MIVFALQHLPHNATMTKLQCTVPRGVGVQVCCAMTFATSTS
jgi:hypothetical protein